MLAPNCAMARLPRLDVPMIPQHVIVRGVNRQTCFGAEGDFAAYLDDLACAARAYECAIHAYVLMTNHIHLLATGPQRGAISRMVQHVGRRYVQRFNASWGRTGTLFQGRFRSSLVDSDRYLLTCMRYIELNPVRAGMVRSATDYIWSSVHANAGFCADHLVTPHDEYRSLGSTDAERATAYRVILAQPLRTSELETIRQHVNRDCALGRPTFQATMARACGRRAEVRRSGRPARVDRDQRTIGAGKD
jgi:putative transposase